MDIKLNIKNADANEVIKIYGVKDRNKFSYTDSYGAKNTVRINGDTLTILRTIDTHKTYVHLNIKESYIRIIAPEGELKFDTKVLAFIIEDSIITIAYVLENSRNEICINYIGE